MWYGVPLVVLTVPSRLKITAQGVIALLVWSGPLVYFIDTSSSLRSIVQRTSVGWTVLVAGIVGVLTWKESALLVMRGR